MHGADLLNVFDDMQKIIIIKKGNKLVISFLLKTKS